MKEEDLIVGEVYYLCGYSDPSGTTPQIFSLQFEGRNCSWNENINLNEDYYVFSNPGNRGQEKIRQIFRSSGFTFTEENIFGMETIIPSGSLHELRDLDGLIEFLNTIQRTCNT